MKNNISGLSSDISQQSNLLNPNFSSSTSTGLLERPRSQSRLHAGYTPSGSSHSLHQATYDFFDQYAGKRPIGGVKFSKSFDYDDGYSAQNVKAFTDTSTSNSLYSRRATLGPVNAPSVSKTHVSGKSVCGE